jgi:hypothetical protein
MTNPTPPTVQIESLEGRRLFSGTAASALTVTPTATPAVRIATPKALTAAQLVGTYTGTLTVDVNSFYSFDTPFTIRIHNRNGHYGGTATVKGNTYAFPITSKQMHGLREKTSTFAFNQSGESGTITINVGGGAKQIAGHFSGSGKFSGSGDFSMNKTSNK